MPPSPFLLFDFAGTEGQPQRLCFTDPTRIVAAYALDEVQPALRAVYQAARAGSYAAGFVVYEAAPACDPALRVRPPVGALPLLWFGIFDAPTAAPESAPGTFTLSEWQPTVARPDYATAIDAVRAAIARGDTYQANYTMRLRAQFSGDDLAFYEQLRAAQAASYCAYLNLGRYRILSASPELFFRWDGAQIVTRPMKGTAPRGRWPAEDDAQAAWLAASEKNRAENLMIVDLLRNDLGRIAQIGSVRVPALFTVERYRTVHQLTSTVHARTRPGTQLADIFTALFPCGSITGAPKIETMKLLTKLEDTPRGVYCGAIGIVAPGGAATFNVAIRTVALDTATGTAEYGVGGGITWDSNAADEYAEALLKAALLRERWPSFELLETMRLEQGEYTLRARHLARLAASARYFGIPLHPPTAAAALDTAAQQAGPGHWRVRLLVRQDGQARTEYQPLGPAPTAPCEVAWARTPVAANDRFLFHKTTHRAIYAARRAEAPDAFDVLLWNQDEQVTEFTIGNLVAEIAGQLFTPPLDCGLLPGTLRAELLAQGTIHERIITRAELASATRLWLINSVRGWLPVRLRDPLPV